MAPVIAGTPCGHPPPVGCSSRHRCIPAWRALARFTPPCQSKRQVSSHENDMSAGCSFLRDQARPPRRPGAVFGRTEIHEWTGFDPDVVWRLG